MLVTTYSASGTLAKDRLEFRGPLLNPALQSDIQRLNLLGLRRQLAVPRLEFAQ